MAANEAVLGIDAGTGSLRAALFALDGRSFGSAECAYETTYPQAGWAEQKPSAWWDALVSSVREVVAKALPSGTRIIALAVDSPCDILLAAADGTPLTNALMWMDLRGASQANRLSQSGDPVLRYCGGTVPAEWPLPKCLWLKEHLPEVWRDAPRLVEQMTWLTWKLTGEWVAPLNSAAAKWHYRDGWPASLMRTAGLEDALEKLPATVVGMGASGGVLTNAAAETLGLEPGIPVAMTGIDAHVGMAGIDVLAPGALALITGTSTCQLAQSVEPVFDPGLWGPFGDAVIAGEWTIEAGQASTGGTVRWLLELIGQRWPERERYARADAAAAATAPGAGGLTILDFWQGSRTPIRDPKARGAIWGLTTAHGPGHLLRAVYEATAFGNRSILQTLETRGVPVSRITACGGGTRSALWLQILSDVAGVPLALTAEDDAVALGSAICAAVAAGAYGNIRAAAREMVRTRTVIEPRLANRGFYDDAYGRYRDTYIALAPLFDRAHPDSSVAS